MQVIEIFDRGARQHASKLCLMDVASGDEWTYREAFDITHRVAHALLRQGIGPGKRAAVLSTNNPLAFLCHLGILRSGAAYVPLNVLSSDKDLSALLAATGCEFLFYEAGLADRVERIERDAPRLRATVAVGSDRTTQVEVDTWMAPEGTRVPLADNDGEAPGWILGTGGTTGRPKAVVLSQRAIVTQTLALVAHLPEGQPIQIATAPMTHAAGGLTYPVLMQGGTTLVHRGFDPDAVLASITERRATRLFLPPTAIYSLLAHPGVREADFTSLRYFIYGAAPISVAKLHEAMEVFGPVMTQFFGQAESPTICTFMGPQDHVEAASDPAKEQRLASCGQASYVAQVRILDEAGDEVANGAVGEITVRTPLRMSGYLDDPVRTAEIDRGGGWQGTGDLGHMDDDGYVYIVDRSRDVINSGGFNVYPSEVEQVLTTHPSVKDCAVVGRPDDHWGEVVTAVVELKPDAYVDAEELIGLCKEELGSVKAPKSVIFQVLPRSAVGKVLKRDLRDQFWVGRSRPI